MKFTQSKGSAIKSDIIQYKMKEGDNVVRLVGDLLCRYVYWIDGENGKNLPFECLSFDRDEEKFNNKEKDWVKDFYPDMKCGWAYAVQCIDPTDNTIKVFNLKKKLTEQIQVNAEDLGDPTDLDNGWDVYFKKVRTGSHQFNVEYQLQPVKCLQNKGPVTDEQRALVAEMTPIEDVLIRPTPDAQKELLERLRASAASSDDNDDKEAIADIAG